MNGHAVPDQAPAPVPRHAGPRTDPDHRRTPAAHGPDQTEAGREVIEALGIALPTEDEGDAVPAGPEPASPEPADPEPADPEPASPARASRPAPPPPGPSTDVVFAPQVTLRRALGLLLLLLLPTTAGAAYLAYEEPRTITLGATGVLLVLTLAIYAVRVGSAPAHLAIHGGQLEVVRGNTREVFDLTSRFTRLEVIGRPGRPGWKVLMARFGREPLVIDSSMVDPAQFTAAIERHRPRAS